MKQSKQCYNRRARIFSAQLPSVTQHLCENVLESTVKNYTKNSYTAYKTTTGDKRTKSSTRISTSILLWMWFKTKAMATLRENVFENKNGPVFVTYLATELLSSIQHPKSHKTG